MQKVMDLVRELEKHDPNTEMDADYAVKHSGKSVSLVKGSSSSTPPKTTPKVKKTPSK